MCLVHQYELIARRVKLVQSSTRCDALYRGDGYVSGTRGLVVAHFDVYMFIGVCKAAMTRSLFNEFAAMGEDERLGSVASGGYAVDEVGEDDGLAGASRQRDAEALVAGIEVGEYSLYAVFLVLAQLDLQRRGRRRSGRQTGDHGLGALGPS